MGYQRSMWRSLTGGGGGDVAVVRCFCSEEQVKISFRSVEEDRRLRRVFVRRWFESPCLSTASISSDERAPSSTPSDSSDLLASYRRPVSLISTLSSGSGSSRDDNLALPSSITSSSSDPDINLNLSPEEVAADLQGSSPQPNRKGRSFIHNKNNNNKDWKGSRTLSRRQPASPFIRASMAPNPQLTYLDRVVMEIIETERMYVRDLRMIVEDYLAHIIDQSDQSDLSIRPELVCALFGNIEDIYEFNSELLQDLDQCDNDPVAIARCFVIKSEYFDIYTQYCTNYPNSVAALTECMRNKSLAKFFRDRQSSLKRSLPLGSYLLKPVQRILKYHLLLQEIEKHFDPEDDGYEVVEEALYTMTGVAWYINDMKRKHEHAVRLQEVQSLLLNWKGPDLTTYGELVLEGNFKVHRARNERTLFLFDRVLLITKRRGEHYVYKTHISCSTLTLNENAKDSLSFSVMHYKNPKQPHTVQAKTVEEKKLWAHHIKRIIVENHQAIIPQKAKEAILEMDSIYPSKYRYSPERLKKATSCHSDEFPRDARQGRRQSEPIKQTLKSNKALLECSDDRRSLRAAVSSSMLGESVTEEEAELGSRKDSLERLLCSVEEAGQLDDALLEDKQETEGGSVSSDNSNKENGRLPEEEEPGGTEPTPKQPAVEKLPQEKMSEPISEPEHFTDPTPSNISNSCRKSDNLKPEVDPEPTEEPSSATPDSDLKTLSSGESSDDEDNEKETAEKEGEAISILPSSVLDKASSIAQHFTNSIKRGTVAQDDARSLGCPSPRLPSRSGSSLSLSAEADDRPPRLCSFVANSAETFGGSDLTMLSPRDDSLFDSDRSIRRRRDSTLSKQDQLLIGKIKSYYENAENQDATFSLRRRESLTYIPSGLVRSSVSRFNSTSTSSTSTVDPTYAESHSALPQNTQDLMGCSGSLDSLKSEQRSTDPEDSEGRQRSRSQSVQDNLSDDEDFKPSSEMIKIWQAMERDIKKSQSEDGGQDRTKEAAVTSRTSGLSFPTKNSSRESRASDLRTIKEESTSPMPLKPKASEVNRTGSVRDTLKMFGEEAAVLRAPVPQVNQLKVEAEKDHPSSASDQVVEVDKIASKVLHLARQYSQRIKTSSPVVRQRSQGLLFGKKSLASVVEEREGSGKSSLTLPLVSHKQATSLPLSPVDHVRSLTLGFTSSSAGNSRGVSSGRPHSRSPLSPPPPLEGFNWPDVQELRSKYSANSCSQKSAVSRSRSIPEQFDSSLRRHSSCSSGCFLADEAPRRVSSQRPHRNASREERSRRLLRANSLDPRLSESQMSELQKLQDQVANDGYYIAAEAPLTNDPEHKIIVMEKLPEPEETARDKKDESYIQIRSPTSREKISIMAVIDRCRAYQESDEYQQREELKAKTEQNKSTALSADQDVSQKTRSTSGPKAEGQQSIVKNLRERFQSLS
ncbi:pleckstrin homology domain-containing family G member 3 isoform X3 [Simochromis diagramma]|uniref:pleckstrin homology domain-containing family G member 3 isoform X3 n=1 Tax=Simochromis diagramma TaxID=43689 RepID=UPI001A7E7FD7|nr:pleckstrin homology domain-containing family G member 3 isoform X3 [Simochromis diagramma]